MPDFTSYLHPVLAVACPTCRRADGLWCVRPSGHKASHLHRSRGAEADRVFVAQHGPEAAIHRDAAGGWWIEAPPQRPAGEGASEGAGDGPVTGR